MAQDRPLGCELGMVGCVDDEVDLGAGLAEMRNIVEIDETEVGRIFGAPPAPCHLPACGRKLSCNEGPEDTLGSDYQDSACHEGDDDSAVPNLQSAVLPDPTT